MRDELNILWVDDSDDWMKSEKGILNRYLEDMKVKVKWESIVEADILYKRVKNHSIGFGNIDIFLIDYNLSLRIEEEGEKKEVYGNDIIRSLRDNLIDVDILFYSNAYERKLTEIISSDLNAYEGVYISNKANFRDKVMKIIRKNSRKLYELSNIRGFLTNQTSENDFIVNSTIYKGFDFLDTETKLVILSELANRVNANYEKYTEIYENFLSISEKKVSDVNNRKYINIRKLLRDSSKLITQEDRYSCFEIIISHLEFNNIAEGMDIQKYIKEIIKTRNNLAHKKLEICDTQQYIRYADDIDQFYKLKKCPTNCTLYCSNNDFISIQQWNEIKNEVYNYSKTFDDLLDCLQKKYLFENEKINV